MLAWAATATGQTPTATLAAPGTAEGYVCRLLVNEVPFPGERGYKSEQDTMDAMVALLSVLDGRLHRVPPPYRQRDIAAVTTTDIIDVITAGGEHGQFDGFYRDDQGKPAMVPRVTERFANLMKISQQGKPGKFAKLLNFAAGIATDFTRKQLAADPYVLVVIVNGVPATGGAYSWMTDEMRFNPGGNFLRITDAQQGSLGGNRFFTLRKNPQ
jgi:hypothetical protein